MAPRQRLSPQSSSIGEMSLLAPRGPLVGTTNDEDDLKPLVSPLQVVELQDEKARERHDYFNLYALVFVIAATAVNWDVLKLLQGYGPGVAYNGRYFWLNWATTVFYFAVDLLWVARVPLCVKSPGTIIKHHLVAIAYLSGPVCFPKYRWFMGAVLTVEINTWFMILRRIVYKRPPDDALPQLVVDVVSAAFYLSWILIRIILFPAILVRFLDMAMHEISITKIYWHWPMSFIPVHFILCVLNLKWSYDLFRPIIVGKWFSSSSSSDSAKPVTVSSGL